MIDREKVKNALERCLICDISVVAPEEAQNAYRECEYTVGLYCGQKRLLQDAHDLLEEQQQQIYELQDQVEYLTDKQKEQETANVYKCPNCGTWVSAENVVRCKDCIYGTHEKNESTGKEWIYCQHHWESRPPEWFCASGSALKVGERE